MSAIWEYFVKSEKKNQNMLNVWHPQWMLKVCFSVAGLIMSDKQNRLNPENAEIFGLLGKICQKLIFNTKISNLTIANIHTVIGMHI